MNEDSEISDKWLEEIVRETEHYYQGEMQQETRASWLLGTASALIAIFIGVFSASREKCMRIDNVFFLIPLCAFLISAIIAIVGLAPYRGTKGAMSIFVKDKHNDLDLSIDKFIKNQFLHDELWTTESLQSRIFFHFRSHYLRNLQKSQKVILSAGFLFIGLLSSLLLIWKLLSS